MSAHTLFLDLQRKGYKKGTPIILSSCFAANQPEALELSKLTGGIVYAARAFVTVPNDVHRRYDMTVYSKGYGVGEKSGYARFENGREVPSDLLGLTYNPETRQWLWRRSEKPAGLNIRVPYQDKSLLTQLREGWHW